MNTLFKYMEYSDAFFLTIFNRNIKCKSLDILMPVATYIGSSAFMAVLCIFLFLDPDPVLHSTGIKCAAALITSGLFVQIVKRSVNRIRPFLKFTNLNIRKIGIDEYSFPSGHTTAAFTAAVMLSLCLPYSYAFMSVACLVGISRMYLGVHYPTDVMAGVFIGTITSLVTYNIL